MAVIDQDSDQNTAPPPRSGTFDSLREPAFLLLWLGGLATYMSVQAQMVARGWLAELLTGTNSGLGAVYFGFGVSMLLCTPFGGVASDRFSKRTVLLGGQLALTSISVFMAVAVYTDIVEFWMLVLSSIVQAAAFSFVGPARVAFSAELVGRSRVPNAIALSQLSLNGTRVIAPAAAGVLIGVQTVGLSGVYVITAAISFISLALTLRLPPGLPNADRALRSPLNEMRDGVQYVWRRPDLRLLWLASTVVVMFAFPYMAFFPRMANGGMFDVGSIGFGFMSTATAVGAVISSLWISSRLGADQGWKWMTVTGLTFGLFVAALSIAPNFPVALAVIFFIGIGSASFQVVNSSLMLTESEPEYHGRVQALAMLAFSGFGLVALPLGLLADAIGLRPTLAIMGGIAMAAIAIYTALIPRYRPSAT